MIGINDAERIYPADITVFHADWVQDALEHEGPRARLYVTSTDFAPKSAKVVRAPHAQLTQENADLMVQRLLGDDIVIEDVLFLTALQIAHAVAAARGRKQTVYMVGFDFRAEAGSAQAIKLPSTISDHTDYLAEVARTCDRPVVISTGMTDRAFERWVLDTFAKAPRLYLLQCNSAYPTPAEDCNVGVVRHYARLAREDSRIVPGYSSHDHGWFGSALAVAAGARMIEKHVKLGNSEWAHFDAVALDLTKSDFREYVGKVREAEIMLGAEEKAIQPSEHHKYRR